MNLAGASASVRVQPGVDGKDLVAAVERIGYSLTPHDADYEQRDVVEMYSE